MVKTGAIIRRQRLNFDRAEDDRMLRQAGQLGCGVILLVIFFSLTVLIELFEGLRRIGRLSTGFSSRSTLDPVSLHGLHAIPGERHMRRRP